MKLKLIVSLLLFSLVLAAKDPYAGLSRQQLKDKLTLTTQQLISEQSEKDSIEAELARNIDSLKAAGYELDSLKDKVKEFYDENAPAEKPDSPLGWVWMILVLVVKFVGTPLFASIVSFYMKTKTKLGPLFNGLKGDGAGFWILLLVCGVVGVVWESFFDGPLSDFSFVDAFGKSGMVAVFAMALYHIGLLRFLKK